MKKTEKGTMQPLDPGDVIIDALEACCDDLERRQGAPEKVVEAIKNLRAAIIEHDLRSESAPRETFENLDDLLSALKRPR